MVGLLPSARLVPFQVVAPKMGKATLVGYLYRA